MSKEKENNLLFDTNEWTFESLDNIWKAIEKIAQEEYGLDYYPPQFDVISSEQMMDAYTSNGLPVMYNHWSFGKNYAQTENSYKRGQMGLAFEIVINSKPCINYIMEENSQVMQTLVMAHAAVGHSSFFKGNYLFRQWTDADSIVDYLLFAKNYILKCEEKYGHEAVESLLDTCHALEYHGVDKYKKPRRMSAEKEMKRQQERITYAEQRVDDLWKTLPPVEKDEEIEERKRFLSEPQENILYFVEKNAPLLKDWEREIVRIVRKKAQYFYPQMQTKVMNEGWASFWHYTILHRMYEKGLIHDGHILEILKSHTGVIYQPDWDDERYSGINPYYLGFNMFMDIKRICEEPTEEDKRWFPDLANTDWLESITYAMKNFKDESFILQYLSPKLIRDLKLIIIEDKESSTKYKVSDIHDDIGYRTVREKLAKQYEIANIIPNIQITDFDIEGDRTLYLEHIQHNQIPLGDTTEEMMKHLFRLWGFDVMLESYDPVKDDITDTYGCMVSK